MTDQLNLPGLRVVAVTGAPHQYTIFIRKAVGAELKRREKARKAGE
ncbi:hypothetical protein [Azospirillum sp. SYSU D00513]|nr:hypothetical protein [Azospirillum sp. SYSU D00513]